MTNLCYEPEVEVLIKSETSTKVLAKIWSGDLAYLDKYPVEPRKNNMKIMEMIDNVKNYPWKPKFWYITGDMARTFNSNVLPLQYQNSADDAWARYSYTAAQIAEAFYKQLSLDSNTLESILKCFLPIQVEIVGTKEVWEELSNSENPNIAYLGKKIERAIKETPNNMKTVEDE